MAYVEFLDKQKQVNKNKKIGTQGYCMGGPLVFRTCATVPERVGAGATFHGGGLVTKNPNSPHLLVPKMKVGMYIGIAASDDKTQPDAKDKLRGGLRRGTRSRRDSRLGRHHPWLVRAGHAAECVRSDLQQTGCGGRVGQAGRTVQGGSGLIRALHLRRGLRDRHVADFCSKCGVKHRFVQVNGIRMHIAEQGEGPLVILLTGSRSSGIAGGMFCRRWPRRVITRSRRICAAMGRPTLRRILRITRSSRFVGDMVGLVHALGYEQAVIAGHDWGTAAATYSANLRPDMFRAVILLSVPYGVRAELGVKPTEGMRLRSPAGHAVLPDLFPDAGRGRKGIRGRPETDSAHAVVFGFGLDSERKQVAVYVRAERKGSGRLHGSETAAALAETGRSGLLREGIFAHRVSRRVELVSVAGPHLGARQRF